eukprot:276082-Rhodomonas_salina.1
MVGVGMEPSGGSHAPQLRLGPCGLRPQPPHGLGPFPTEGGDTSPRSMRGHLKQIDARASRPWPRDQCGKKLREHFPVAGGPGPRHVAVEDGSLGRVHTFK